jgi:hypothetical protein
VSVAARLFAGGGGAVEVGDDGFKIADEQGKAFRFRAQGEELLFEIQIERQGAGQIERKKQGISGGKILLGASNREEFGVKLNGARSVFLRRCTGFVVDDEDLALEIRAFLIDAQELETLAAFADEIEAAVGILFYDSDDFGGASHFSETPLDGADDAEGAIMSQTFADHFFVARFENVQREGCAWKQDDVEREQGNKGVQEDLQQGGAVRLYATRWLIRDSNAADKLRTMEERSITEKP